MTANDLFAVLAGMTHEQREREVVVMIAEGRPYRQVPVKKTGIHYGSFWLEIDP